MNISEQEQLKFLFDKNEEMEDMFGTGVDTTNQPQFGGNPPFVSWEPEVRATTAELLGLASDATDDQIIPILKDQLLLHNWVPFAIDVLTPLFLDQNGNIKNWDTNIYAWEALKIGLNKPKSEHNVFTVKTEGIFKFAWLYSIVQSYGKEFLIPVDKDVSISSQKLKNIETYANLRTLSLDEFDKWWNKQTIVVRNYIRKLDQTEFTRLDRSTTEPPPHLAISILWPCQTASLSANSYLKYFFYNTILHRQHQIFYPIVPISILTNLKSSPHDAGLLSPFRLYEHDLNHTREIQLRLNTLNVDEHQQDFAEIMQFVLRDFHDLNKQIIQHLCTEIFFQYVHEKANNFSITYNNSGWKGFFDDKIIHLVGFEEPDENALEKLLWGRSVKALIQQLLQYSECETFATNLSHFITPFNPSDIVKSYISPKLVKKFFGNDPPITLNIRDTNRLREFERALYEAMNCLVKHTDFTLEDGFRWDKDIEVYTISTGGRKKKRKRITKRRSKRSYRRRKTMRRR